MLISTLYLGLFCAVLQQPSAMTRKSALQFERQSSEVSYYADDEDGNQKKYSRRGE